ncbi:MAG TPA: murein biosynthesis integral membrane protein MurJ, partial [Burkholderiales bacterium]|nr:murein biosynthesis integral membrane protein MurJ [Burkholderiales bacterium]
SSMTLLSRILGFVRDTAIARVFGAGLATDAFFVAFKIPNFLRRLFAEGAFSQAFVPILGEYRNRRGEDELHELIDYVSGMLALALFVVTLLGVLAAPYIIYVSAPGFAKNADKFNLTVDLLRITFPYLFFISLTALAGGILNTYSRFAVPAFTPVLLNLSFIVFTLWLAPYFDPPAKALAWAVFAGGVLQLAFQAPFLTRLRVMPRFKLNFKHEGMRRVLRQMGPALFGVSVGQISLLLNVIFASFLVTGSVSWLYYADRLMEFPAGMLGVALGTILLPGLSNHYANRSDAAYSALLDWGLRLAFLLAVPSAVGLALLAMPLITTLFMYGAFSVADAEATRAALMAYSVGLIGLILVKVLAPAFYARQDIRTPVKIAVVTLVITQLLNFALIGPLQHAGLALATGLGSCLNAALLYYLLRRRAIHLPRPGWAVFLLKLLFAVVLMAATLWFAADTPQRWIDTAAPMRVAWLLGLVSLGAAVYFAALWLLGFRVQDFARFEK